MISYIVGKLTFKDPTYIVVETHGIGYQVKISLHTYSAIKDAEQCKILTYLHIKEDAHTLYGFVEPLEKKLFLHLISISGIGPGTAIIVLSSLNPSEIQNAIISEDLRTIQSIKGIGAKTAQRIILELKDKIKKDQMGADITQIAAPSYNTIKSEALSALITLGIAKNIAEKNIETVIKREGDAVSLEQLIKLSLKLG